MDAMGRYIYGVIGSSGPESFPLDGVVPFDTDPAQDDGPSERAYTISWRDLAAVVTESPVVDYAAMPKTALARLLVRHQQVIEKVMAKHTIVPLRLGTCAASDDHVLRILASGYETIKDTLRKAQDVVEIDVTACLGDFDSFLRHISQLSQIAQLRQSFLDQQALVTVEDQVKVGMLVKQHADQEKQRLSKQIVAALMPITEDVKAHDLMDDKMILNSAFLIRKDRQEAFDRQIEDLNAQSDNQLDFRCVGPLPPYSFYTLEARVTDREEVSWARRQLGLHDSSITVDAIKKAHRRVALTCHPDKNPNVPGIEKKFDDMSRAYRILLDYCRTSGRIKHEGETSCSEQALEDDTILVTTMT
ncbi:MAG: hypothetical protein A2Y76_13425 [Planctomycetes bacterium RBG_13_60_9]|nr:MAG: hypothetical protein A2Y76_13425 [Planctomycetes bacterium RBG_13_60_9]